MVTSQELRDQFRRMGMGLRYKDSAYDEHIKEAVKKSMRHMREELDRQFFGFRPNYHSAFVDFPAKPVWLTVCELAAEQGVEHVAVPIDGPYFFQGGNTPQWSDAVGRDFAGFGGAIRVAED